MAVLHGLIASPPCRAALLVAKAIGVDLEMKEVNIMAGENRTPEYLELNPRHTIPTLDDDGYILTESRAIMCYLVDKYGAEDDPLYPKDAQLRGRVLERLMFDQGCLFARLVDYYNFAWIFKGEDLDETKSPALDEAFGFLDKYLESSDWAAGDSLTIADVSLAVTVSQAELFGYDLEPYANINRWFEACKNEIVGYEEINQEGLNVFKSFLKH